MHTPRQKPFQITTMVFWFSLVLALGAWGLYAYLFHEVAATGTSTAALRTESDKLEHQQSEVLELKRDLASNQARKPVLVSYFVEATDPVPLFETLEGYGRTTNVAVKISSVDVKKGPERLMVTLTGSGSFSDVYRFIALLEAAPYQFSVSDASVRALAKAADDKKAAVPTVWETRITLTIASVTGVAQVPVK